MMRVNGNSTDPVSEDPVQPIVPRPERTEFQRRKDRAAESILDNERLTTDLDDSLPPVPCLPGEFNQVILNLVVNAAHAISDKLGFASPEKGTIRVRTRALKSEVEVSISDTGGGIPQYEDCAGIREAAKRLGKFAGISDSDIVIQYSNESGIYSTSCPPTQDVSAADTISVSVNTSVTPMTPIGELSAIPISSSSSRTILKNVKLGFIGTGAGSVSPTVPYTRLKKGNPLPPEAGTPSPGPLSRAAWPGAAISRSPFSAAWVAGPARRPVFPRWGPGTW